MSGIYIHIPFCKQACSYCDFYFVTKSDQKEDFVSSLILEIAAFEGHLFTEEVVRSVYFGGGTPSLLTSDQLKLLKHSYRIFEKLFNLDLPYGVIHSDLFRDNVLASKNKITGIIDYYYSFNGPLIYELAVIANDWCINKDGTIHQGKFTNLISSYNSIREINKKEMKYMNNAMVAAALRFYLSRLTDMIFPKVGEITHIKDPNIFENILLKRIEQK